jgi:hypothetical protein
LIRISSGGGVPLAGQKGFSHLVLTSHGRNHEFMLAITLDPSNATAGTYVLEHTTHDVASDNSAVISPPFAIGG